MSRPLYVLLIAAPLAIVADWLQWPSAVVFGLAALGVIPLAGLIGTATEELSIHIGPKYGGLLNATFGNAAELIITTLAIRQGLLSLVKASITGSIIGNSLLVLGLSIFLGGIKHGRQSFDREEALHHITLMLLATAGLFLPALFAVNVPNHAVIEEVSLFTAGVLLLTYVAYIAYSVFLGEPPSDHENVTGKIQQQAAASDVAEHHTAAWSVRTSLIVLAVATGATVVVSELLVRTVEPVTHQFGWSEFFVGIIIVPLIGNAAEHFSALTFASKNRMDVTMAIAAGSSTQIALFVAPFLVFLSLLLGNPLDLVFTQMELLVLGLTTAIFAFVALDGRSNWLEGVQLLALYLIVGVVFFFLPTVNGGGAVGH
ncbi:MAG: calcium/proton exchanger [Chloroflexi bacterium]|nr:calcium/proton exchanger [Chloroflexota bacterium]